MFFLLINIICSEVQLIQLNLLEIQEVRMLIILNDLNFNLSKYHTYDRKKPTSFIIKETQARYALNLQLICTKNENWELNMMLKVCWFNVLPV